MLTRFDTNGRLAHILRLIHPIHLNMQRMREACLDGSGLSVAERELLDAVDRCGPLSASDAARALSVKRQFVQRCAGALVASGHLERVSPDGPRGVVRFALTSTGKAAFDRVQALEMETLKAHLGDINLTEAIVAARVLGRISGALEALADAPATREDEDDPWRHAFRRA